MSEPAGRSVLCRFVGCGECVVVGDLRGHLSDHLRYYPFKCAHCDSVFANEDKLRLHGQLRDHRPIKIVEDPILEKEQELERLMTTSLTTHPPPANKERPRSSSAIPPASTVETNKSTGLGGCGQKRSLSGPVEAQAKQKKVHGESSGLTCGSDPPLGLEAPHQNPPVAKCGLCSFSFQEGRMNGSHIQRHAREQMKAEGGGSYNRIYDQVARRCFSNYVPTFGRKVMDCVECGVPVKDKPFHVLLHHIHKPAFRCPHCNFRQFYWSMSFSATGQEHMELVHGEPWTMLIDDRAGLKAELEAWLRRCFGMASSKKVERPDAD